jgi:hypothetical protein
MEMQMSGFYFVLVCTSDEDRSTITVPKQTITVPNQKHIGDQCEMHTAVTKQ